MGRQLPSPTNISIIESFVSDEERPQKVGDVFLEWLGEEEVVYVGEGEDMPVGSAARTGGCIYPFRGMTHPRKGYVEGEGNKSNRKSLRGARRRGNESRGKKNVGRLPRSWRGS